MRSYKGHLVYFHHFFLFCHYIYKCIAIDFNKSIWLENTMTVALLTKALLVMLKETYSAPAYVLEHLKGKLQKACIMIQWI